MDIDKIWSGQDLSKQNSRCLSLNTILAGKYLVGPVLGQGGFGITYLGHDLNMETRIAIKEYFPVELVSRDTTTVHGDRVLSLSGEKSVTYQQGLKKYVAEAQNVSQFSEVPGVVSVKDFFFENETAYIVMEYIDGISLKEYLKQHGGRISEKEMLSIMKPVLEALEKVHEAGIIHRDISPDNIMLTLEENRITSVKLIDFGAARMTAKDDQKSLTIILKHGYAPEEQYRTHGEQGPWTDVYAVCAVMYRMLTGQTPVPAMDRVFQDELKSFADCNAVVCANTERAILKGLAVKKNERTQGIRELYGALYEGKTVKTSSIKTEKQKKSGAVMAIVGVAAAALCVVAVGSGIFGANSRKEQGSVLVANPDAFVAEQSENDRPMLEQSVQNATVSDDNVEVELSMEVESDLGDTIVYWHPQSSMSGGEDYHVLICKQDGTVQAMGSNGYGQCMVEDWTDIVAVSANHEHSLGLRSDGKVFAVGNNDDGQCEVGAWEDIIQIAAGRETSYGLTADGRVLGVGDNHNQAMETISEWTNIKAITIGYTDDIIGLDYDGNLHYAGNDEEWQPVSEWQDVNHMIFGRPSVVMGLKEDGTCVLAELKPVDWTKPNWEEFSNLQQVYGFSSCIGVREDGTVMVDDAFPYSGFEEKKAVLDSWSEMEAVINASSSDRAYIIGLKSDDSIIEFEQCYGNSNPEEMQNLEWIDILEVSGYSNLVGKTKDGALLTYGLEYFRMDEYANFQSANDIEVSNLCEIVGYDLVLTKDGELYNRYRMTNECLAKDVKQALDIGPYSAGLFAVLKENGQIEFLKEKISYNLTDLAEMYYEWVKSAEEWSDVIQITGSDYVLFGLREDGSVVSTKGTVEGSGYTKIQCNEYVSGTEKELIAILEDGTAEILFATEQSEAFGRTQISNWDQLVDIGLGESHVAGLRADGTVVAAGSNHCGQCDVEEWKDIERIKIGKNCTLGIDKNGKLWMAGSLF